MKDLGLVAFGARAKMLRKSIRARGTAEAADRERYKRALARMLGG